MEFYMENSVLNIALNKDKCCGCSSCESVCPVSAISMINDEDGFLYPFINGNKCINCGKCRTVCPVENCDSKSSSKPSKIYSFCHSDEDIWIKSTSGGAFTAIIQELLLENKEKDFYVCGAIFDSGKVVHRAIKIYSIKDLDLFHKSKYVQSDIRNVYKEIDAILKEKNSFLVFAGTPCQVKAIRNVFRSYSNKMFLIDFVCHGVGSPLFFEKYCTDFYNKPITNYSFREKKIVFNHLFQYFSKFTISKRTHYRNRDAFNRLFLEQLITRKVCNGHCLLRTSKRVSDLTLGDFRNVIKYISDADKQKMNTQKNYSMIIPNSDFGESIIKNIGNFGNLFSAFPEGINENPLYFKNLPGNDARDSFFEFFRKNGIKKAVKKYIPHYRFKKYSYIIHALKDK